MSLLVVSMLAAPTAHATAQVANILVIEGEQHALRARPLSGTPHKVERRREKDWSLTTACRSSHVTVWSIEQKQLWFLGTRACVGSKTLSAGEVLKGVTDERIVAGWYSGTLVLPQGELVNYVHGGWGTLYSEERHIVIEHGQVMTDSVKQLVASGFKKLEDLWLPAPLLLPADIAEAQKTAEQMGDQRWISLKSEQPGRLIRIREPVMDLEEGVDVPALLSATLTDHLSTRGSQQHHTLKGRGTIIWVDRPGSDGGLVRIFAWVHHDEVSRYQLSLFELHLPQSAADELEVFTAQLDLPRTY